MKSDTEIEASDADIDLDQSLKALTLREFCLKSLKFLPDSNKNYYNYCSSIQNYCKSVRI